MKTPFRIAIYSGDIPSTTFIERLIEGSSEAGQPILLFGLLKSKVNYPHKVKVVGYRNTKLSKLWHLVYYSTLLILFKHSEKKQLDALLRTKKKFDLYTKVKYYPVLWYQPTIFHIQWAKGLDDWMWVQNFGIKLVLSLRGAHINYSPIVDQELAAMYRLNFPKVDAFHAVSKAISIEADKYGAVKERIQVIKSGLTMASFPFEMKSEFPKRSLTIVSVGREHWIKNYGLALDVMSVLKSKDIDFHYSIIGIDDNEALLFQRSQLELEQNVTFIKALPFEDVQKAIIKADVLLLPSLKEGIANVVLEAMALGTLVISTDCGGMAEVVIPNQTGFLVPIRNIEAMANAIEEVSMLALKDYQTLTATARAFVAQYHSTDDMITEMSDLYNSLNVETR